MYRLLYFLLLLPLLFGCDNSVPAEDEWEMVWGDEFNYSGPPDATKWENMDYLRRGNDLGPDGWWLREDAYADGQGNLVIRVKKIENRNDDLDPWDYSSGAIRSKGRFEQLYGRFEIRCKLPSQPGWWVAFWLLSESVVNVDGSGEDGTEIDIFEAFGWTDRLQHTLHWDGYEEDEKAAKHKMTIEGIREGYHVFALEWTENEYIFYIDSVETWRTSAGGVSKVPAWVKVTGELSTQLWAITNGWAGNPANADYPDYFLVDYVRVYQRRNR